MTDLQRTSEQFSEDERKTLLSQFESSGLEMHEFAREHNLNPNTLRNWLWIKRGTHALGKRYSPTERKKMVESFLGSGMTLKQFSSAWGVGPSTLHTWVTRYQENGSDGLMNQRLKPTDRRLGSRIPKHVQTEIINRKKAESGEGARSIRNWLFRFKGMKVSHNSVQKTIKNEGLPVVKVPRKKRRSSEKVRRFERSKPMQLWQSDITQFTLGPSSMRVYLTVFMDDHSRYIVGWRLMSRQPAELVLDAFKDAMVRFGKPEEVLTDQGRQYFAWRGKSELEKLLEKEGIKHVVSRAHHPQTLGKCERFWETVYNEFWTRVKPQDLEEAKVRFKYFIDHYNHQRPHQGIDGMTPADRFFGVAEEVREIIEKTVAENAIRLATGELPSPPAFLIGQIGEKRIAFHGKAGDFILTNENILGERNGINESGTSVSQYAINREGSAKTETKSKPTESSALASHELSGDTGAGSLGCSDGGRAWTSEAASSEDIRNMDRINVEGASCDGFEFKSDPVLATEQPGACGNDGGIINPATHPSAAEYGDWNDGPRRDQHAEKASPRA